MCVIARGTKEQKPPFSVFLSVSVPWSLFKSIWCFFCVVLGRPGSSSGGYFHAKTRGTRRTAKSNRSKPALPRGTGLFLSGSMITLSIPRRLRGPTRADSMRNPNDELANRTFDTTGGKVPAGGVLSVRGRCQQQTPTHGRGGNMGDLSVALTWSSAVDGRPDWPSDSCRRHWPNVWCECCSLSTHCTKDESARFDHCRNRFCIHLYSAVHPDAPRKTSGEVRTTSGRTSHGDAS